MTPDFVKALDIGHAMDGKVMPASAMNGEDLPWLNGFPLRLVVPKYFGTNWVKHLSEIMVLDQPFDGYWMTKTYRRPDKDCSCVPVGTAADSTVPIGKFRVRSFLTSVPDGGTVPAGKVALRGIAFYGGSGIKAVDVSIDQGASWQSTRLGEDLGPYSFHECTMAFSPAAGPASVMVRATAQSGEIQPLEASWNPSGDLRNVIENSAVGCSTRSTAGALAREEDAQRSSGAVRTGRGLAAALHPRPHIIQLWSATEMSGLIQH